jgi:hypothetical protein
VSASAPLAPYEAIAAHAELELELAGNGEVEELVALADRWERLIAAAPDSPPPAAGPILERARLIHERTRIELLRLRDSLLGDVATAATAKRTAAGYSGTLGKAPRVDRSA